MPSVLYWFQVPIFIFNLQCHQSNGPKPVQLVVVIAVRKAVSAATNTFTAISIILFFIPNF